MNALTQTAGLSDIGKKLAGIAPQRRIPAFADQTFRAGFRRRKARQEHPTHLRVILWPATFNNHFHPNVCEAAVEVLERVGFAVSIPRRSECCGRPLYDFGLLRSAKNLLRKILDDLRDDIRDGVPIIVLEPSCAAVFRDELVNLFPDNVDAVRLSHQTFLLSEFLERFATGYTFPKLERRAIVHGHCHHKAVMSMSDKQKMLERLGLDFELVDAGCCGMAGAFGFEKQHYEVSIKAGERVLLPRVREAAPETLIIANGFSCREQIAQTTDRRAVHLAEVIRMVF